MRMESARNARPHCKLRKPKVVSEVLKDFRKYIDPRPESQGGGGGSKRGRGGGKFISGDVSEKNMICEMKCKNVGFVYILFF